jgi:hypothetical protein
MNQVVILRGSEPRRILETVIAKRVPIIMSYMSRHKWHVAKVLLSDLGGGRFSVEVAPRRRPHPININIGQSVGMSFKYGYGKFIFETNVTGLEPSPDSPSGGQIILNIPAGIELVQRRSYFRVQVPESLEVDVAIWHRGSDSPESAPPEQESPGDGNEMHGRLLDISAGGAQVAVSNDSAGEFKKGQIVGLRFTPMPYETPISFNSQVRNILPTADGSAACLGLQIVGLEASAEGRMVLARLVTVVEQYYRINQAGAKQFDMETAIL